MRTLKNKKVVASLFAIFGLIALTASSCDSNGRGQSQESERRQENYDRLVASQPGETMDYSPTRETINFWINTWEEPGKLAYVYMMASNGQLVGYYIFEGLPVSYCALLTPTYEGYDFNKDGNDSEDVIVQAPSIDGVYYSGGQCNQYYGKDATTGSYLEFSVGDGLNYLLYEEPLPRQDIEPLGFATVENVQEDS